MNKPLTLPPGYEVRLCDDDTDGGSYEWRPSGSVWWTGFGSLESACRAANEHAGGGETSVAVTGEQASYLRAQGRSDGENGAPSQDGRPLAEEGSSPSSETPRDESGGMRTPPSVSPVAAAVPLACPRCGSLNVTNDIALGYGCEDCHWHPRLDGAAAVLGEREPPPGWTWCISGERSRWAWVTNGHVTMTNDAAWREYAAARVPPQSEPAWLVCRCREFPNLSSRCPIHAAAPASEPKPMKTSTYVVAVELDEVAASEPTEDRRAPPLEYSAWSNGEGSVFACVGPPEGLACDDIAEAVAACWAHRDRITAPLRAELADARAEIEGWSLRNQDLADQLATARAEARREVLSELHSDISEFVRYPSSLTVERALELVGRLASPTPESPKEPIR